MYENEEGLAKLQDVLKIQLFKDMSDKNSILLKHLGSGPDYRWVRLIGFNLNLNAHYFTGLF